MKLLAIDTSCDETSVAVTDGVRVLSNVVSSQVRYHKKFGGVVPFLAQRLHGERIASVTELALSRAQVGWGDLDGIAITYGPGLAPALQVGISFATERAAEHCLPLYGVNHMAGHIASCMTQVGSRALPPIAYPALAVLVSGGHSELVYMPAFGDYTVVGQTVDDALGEAYDKVAKLLSLGYPGGALLARIAQSGESQAYDLPVPMLRSGDLNLSYSGLKNAVRLLVQDEAKDGVLTREQVTNIAASFERVAQASLLLKIEAALKEHTDVRTVLVAGGVAANTVLRKKVRALAAKRGLAVRFPTNKKLCGDNAAMIGVAAYLGIQNGQMPSAPESLDRKPSLVLGV